MNPWSHTIEALAASVSILARRAVEEYAPIVNAIVSERSQDIRHIEQTLDVLIDDPFDPEGAVSVKLTKAEWRSVNPASTPRDSSHGQHNFSLN